MSDKTKLLPCPFCGKPGEIQAKYSGNITVRCTVSNCRGHVTDWSLDHDAEGYADENEAISAWNRRATIQPTAGESDAYLRAPVACAENGVLRWLTGRKFQDCELYTGPVAPADAVRDARNEALYRLIERLDMVPYASTPHYELARELRALITPKEPAK